MVDDRNHENPLRDLDRAAPPPAELEQRVRYSLRRRGLLRPRAHRWRRPLTLAAAAVLTVAAYCAGARTRTPGPAREGSPYALLLYQDSTFDDSRPEAELVAEYGAWAAALRERGELDFADKLDDGGHTLEAGPDSVVVRAGDVSGDIGVLAGLFVIRARSESDALAIAGACPHLKYGGRVVLRAIAGS